MPRRRVRLAARRQPARGLGRTRRRPDAGHLPDAQPILPDRWPRGRLRWQRLGEDLGRGVHASGRSEVRVKLLAGDTALVTGAASGIGRGISIALAREGARTILSDVDAQRGEAVAASLRAEGLDARFMSADLAAADGPAGLLQRALEAFGELSILVH